MYELSITRKYLIPRVRQLSVSIISLISVVVIATVVWLSIVFFSVQEGIEQRWTEKMLALTAPIRITPTTAYYSSYYFQIDGHSSASHFATKSLQEKRKASQVDPYNPEEDPSLPSELANQRSSLDLVKEAEKAILSIPGLSCEIFETTHATLKLRLVRNDTVQMISQSSYLVNFDQKNPRLALSPKPSQDAHLGEGILVPKSFKDAGVVEGDQGTLSYQGFGATSLQEQRTPVFVAGFYDPGIIPIGGRVILARGELVSRIQQAALVEDQMLPTGFNVHFANLKESAKIKSELQARFEKLGIAPFWNIKTYEEFDFTKDIFQQMKSDRNLFSLISLIIMIVACANIISMLIILVHDKKKEIAVLRALGAGKKNIAAIFGLCGFTMGATGSIIGSCLAIITISNLPTLLQFLGHLQGFEVLNTAFYGSNLPSQVSQSALLFVVSSCTIASSVSGIIPAIQASRINTSEALRNE